MLARRIALSRATQPFADCCFFTPSKVTKLLTSLTGCPYWKRFVTQVGSANCQMPNETKEQSIPKTRAPRNRTITLSEEERKAFGQRLIRLDQPARAAQLENHVVSQDLYEVLNWLPANFVHLAFIDPPYNLTKSFTMTLSKTPPPQPYPEPIYP